MAESLPVILVLDDDPLVTTTVRNYLELSGEYRPVVFNHPAEALEFLKSKPVDVIVSDQIMPGMNGLEFFAQVKQIQPEAIRVLLTGYAQKDDAVRAINQIGLYQYLEKPWSNEQLGLVIRNGVERKRLYSSLQHGIGELKIASGEIDRLRNGLVELYLEKGATTPGSEIQRMVGAEVRRSARSLLYAFLVVSALLAGAVSYIVYGSFFSLRREAAGLRVQLGEIRRSQLNQAEIERLRALGAPDPPSSEQIIAQYEESVCLIQGSFVFRERSSGKILRLAAGGDAGQPRVDSAGNVDLTLEGEGPPVENSYTGTGFLVSPDGKLVTNRHVAEPWSADSQADKILQAGYRPEHRYFVAYFPHRRDPYRLKVRKVSQKADVALLEVAPATGLPKPIPLDESGSGVKAGAPILLIGFPLGLEAILARTSDKELEQIPDLANLDLEQVARELAKRDLVRPFITQGHISNVTGDVLSYDAATATGGSGGPLLNRDGRVIAVNFAFITQFNRASMGLHVRHVLELLR